MGPGVAQECIETKDGLDHLGGPFLSRDRRSPDPARRCAEGETGELVITTLTKEGMPVIRYRTRDLTALLPGTARSMRRHRAGERPQRRHADHSRRQRVSVADRGDPRARTSGFRRTICSNCAGPNGSTSSTSWSRLRPDLCRHAERRGNRRAGAQRRASHQVLCRRDGQGRESSRQERSSVRRARPSASST